MLVQNTPQLPQDLRSAKTGTSSNGANVTRTKPETKATEKVINTEPQADAEQPNISEQLKKAVEVSNNALKFNNTNLQFSVDKDTNTTVIKLVDSETGDVIRQIPSKEMLEIARSISQMQQGLLLKQKA